MSVTLSPISPRYAVSDADDPFKKYWWAILLGIVFTALWLLTPMLGEKSVGSTAISTSAPKAEAGVEQAVADDAGGGINLSMEGTGHKRKEDPLFGSSLYEAPPEEKTAGLAAGASGAAGAASASVTGGTLAGALKKVSESGGGWAEKAQRGFNSPKLGGGSLSGMGAASGGRAGASGGTSAFGSSNANIGFANANGLSGGGGPDAAAPNSKGVAALKAAAAQAQLAAGNQSNDGARSAMSQAFDGAKAGSKIGAGGALLKGGYAGLDAAPANLKLDDPKMNEKKLEAPPPAGTDVGQSAMDDSELGKQIAMQVAAGVLGGVIGGPMGSVVTNVVMQAIQRQMDQQEKIREMEEKQQMDRAARRIGAKPSAPAE